MPSVISGDANVSATEFGFLDGVTSGLQSQIDAKLPLAGGKILQIVRATDSTQRETTSTTFVDVTGMSVTITPQKSDSLIIVAAVFQAQTFASVAGTLTAYFTITDSSDNSLSGAESAILSTSNQSSIYTLFNVWGYATPATTSATTYKLRFRSASATITARARNQSSTGQMYAIEVSA